MKDLFVPEEDASHYVTVGNKETAIPDKFKAWSTFTAAQSLKQAVARAKYQYAYHYLCWRLKRVLKDTPTDKDLIKNQLANFKKNNLIHIISTNEV